MGFIKQVVKQTTFSFSKICFVLYLIFCMFVCVCVCLCVSVGKYIWVQDTYRSQKRASDHWETKFQEIVSPASVGAENQTLVFCRSITCFQLLSHFSLYTLLINIMMILKDIVTYLLVWAQGGASELHWIIFCFLSYHNCKKYTKDI